MRIDISQPFNILYYTTFGANRRSTLYAILIEGISLFGILSLSERGYLRLPEVTYLSEIFAVGTLVTILLIFLIVRSISKETLSPKLQHSLIQIGIVGWYLLLGLSVVGLSYVLSSFIAGEVGFPTVEEIAIGSGICSLYGLFILMYYDRYEVDPPDNRDEFQRLGTDFLASYESLSESEKSPLQLTDSYTAFLCTADDLVGLLQEAETPDGKRLYQDLRDWQQAFQTHNEPAKDMVITGGNSRHDDLQDEHEGLTAIIQRLRSLTDYESA